MTGLNENDINSIQLAMQEINESYPIDLHNIQLINVMNITF